MAAVKIHGNLFSTPTQRVVTVCHEIGLKYELVPVDYKTRAQKQPEYLDTMSPFGQTPVLEDVDGTKLFESRAMCRYLVTKYGKESGLLPTSDDLVVYGLFEQAASIEYSAFEPWASGLTIQRVFKPLYGQEPDETIAAHSHKMLEGKLDGYERILSKQKYLSGDRLTLADLFHLPYGSHVNQLDPSLFGSRPNLKRWWDEITSRESWKAVSAN